MLDGLAALERGTGSDGSLYTLQILNNPFENAA
jgi:hypothetical protein